MAQLNFDASTVEVASFDALPEGAYEVVITDSKLQETKSGNGTMLVLDLEVISGDYQGRRLWDRLNLVNPNATAVDIAKQTLSSICRAVGVIQLNDTAQLHDRPLIALVRQRTRPDGEVTNEIKGYRPKPSAPVTAPAPVPAPAPTPAKVASPWAY